MNHVFVRNTILVISVLIILTGFTFHPVSVSIEGKMKGEISAFVFEPVANISQPESIYVEFLNSGTENYSVKIEIYVYYFDNKLEEKAYYYDSSVNLFPGMRRSFSANYVPNEMGSYYIKARVSYGTKKIESWGVFYSTYQDYSPFIPAENQPIIIYVTQTPSLALDYPEYVQVLPGRDVMTNVKVKNIGNATLHEVKLHLSYTNLLDIDLSPKESYYLEPNETLIFLLDIHAQNQISQGVYPVDFELVTREVKDRGTINVNVSEYNESLKDYVKKSIQNYEYLLSELEMEIGQAKAKGQDVSAAQDSLDSARQNLEQAREYYDIGEYELAAGELEDVKEDLKDGMLKLAQAGFTVFVAPAFSPFWVLIIIAIIATILFFILSRRKKDNKPKLLRATESET